MGMKTRPSSIDFKEHLAGVRQIASSLSESPCIIVDIKQEEGGWNDIMCMRNDSLKVKC